jgi:hypothetical protein
MYIRPSIDDIKKRLSQYSAIRVELDTLEERLERLKSEETLPPMRPSSGSKPTGSTGDRQERSIIRRMEYEERHGPEIDAKRAELSYIEDSINSVDDPMERMVLRILYTGSENAKPMPWRAVAMAIYKDDSDAKMLAIYRLHGRALKSLQSVMLWENASE